ncbi:hypothetical protein BH10ACT3_BH10ACT3_13950 [soil metagenome]
MTIAHRKAIDATRATARHATPVADVAEQAGVDRGGPGRTAGSAGDLLAGPRSDLALDDDLVEALTRLPDK